MSVSDIDPITHLAEYTSFTGGKDLQAIYAAATGRPPRPARTIRVVSKGSGGLVLTMLGSAAAITLTGLVDNEDLPVGQYLTIVQAGSTVSKIRVGW
uniref:Uncharacterized protein n=1 Tax=viral metagenome TaxID=1070528 RepID=A0A6M3IKV6_9ZZZZ